MEKKINIEIVNDIEKAKKIWNKLSPNNFLCDDWNYRYCFYKYFDYPLYFYVGLSKGEIVGLLPLQYNEDEKYLEFFGGGFMKDNRVFIKPEYKDCIKQFYNAITIPVRIIHIFGQDQFTKSFNVSVQKYIADLSIIKDVDDYLFQNFKAKTRYGLHKKIKSIESLDPMIIENNYEDLDLMFELNKKTFGEKSSFNKPYRTETFHDLLKLNFNIHLFSYIINGKKEAVSFSIKYNDIYVYINAGTNKEAISNLGTYNIYKNIDKAVKIKSKIFDAGLEALGWKERWHLKKIPQYDFIYK
ncbi:MAG: GNAT family N-acetyltransferase [Candidatus Pacebacteria bacterium]|nr:GNAT family N-acetyltransferase [Candidatus Paceibacterota bacterium]